MRKFIIVVICLLFPSINICEIAFAKELKKSETQEKEYIISYENSVEEDLIKEVGGKPIKSFKYSPAVTASLTKQQVNKLMKNKMIVDVEQNEKVYAAENDDNMGNYPMNNVTYPSWNLKQTRINKVLNKGIRGGDIKVGVIDSGISTSHFDLKVEGGVNILDSAGTYDDDYGHGTRVAGIIAALDNNIGVKGVAPDAELYSIKVLDSKGEGMISDIISGIEWAIENDIDIINLSVQTTIENKLLKKTINQAIKQGLIIVAAAGNKGYSETESTITYPANYQSVISVGALTKKKLRADFSSIGENLDLMAPGEYVYTTFGKGYFVAFSGTSIATPHVTGTAALMLSVNQSLTQSQIKKILKKSATPLGEERIYGAGELNANKAIKKTEKIN